MALIEKQEVEVRKEGPLLLSFDEKTKISSIHKFLLTFLITDGEGKEKSGIRRREMGGM